MTPDGYKDEWQDTLWNCFKTIVYFGLISLTFEHAGNIRTTKLFTINTL